MTKDEAIKHIEKLLYDKRTIEAAIFIGEYDLRKEFL